MTQGEFSGLEALEPRITPSAMSLGGGVRVGGGSTSGTGTLVAYDLADFGDPEIVSPSELHFRDADGDGVIVKFDRDVLTAEALANAFHFEAGERGSYLAGIDVAKLAENAKSLKGLDVTVSVVAAAVRFVVGIPLSGGNLLDADRGSLSNIISGNERAEIGFIDASGIDLGAVSIEGNLERIVAGDSKLGTAGLGSLTVESLGTLGDAALAEAGDVTSVITGALHKLEVKTDIVAALVNIQGGTRGTLVEAHVGGDVVGGAFAHSGAIEAEGSIKSLTIDGDLVGGSAENAGSIFAEKQIKQLAIGGDIQGGSGQYSGRIASGDMGKLSIAGDVRFGSGIYSATIGSGQNIHSVHVEGDLVGGLAKGTGSIVAGKNIHEAEIQGNVDGGAGDYSGYVTAQKKIGSVVVGGDLLGSFGEYSGSVASFDGRIAKEQVDGHFRFGVGDDSGQILSFVNGSYDSSGFQVTTPDTLSRYVADYWNPNLPGAATADLSYKLKTKVAAGEDYLKGVQYIIEEMTFFLHDEERATAEIFIVGPDHVLTMADLNSGDFILPDSLIFADAADGKIFVTLKAAA